MQVVVWVGVVVAILLAPAPREWGVFGRWISPYYDQVQPAIQPLAHVVLMGVFAVLISRCFSGRTFWITMLYSFVLTMGLAVALELLQNILPAEFARTCDLNDLVPASVGALIGSATGAMLGVCVINDGTS